MTTSGLFRVLGQPNLNFTVDRKQAARYQINVSDVQDAIQTAVGGNAVTQVLKGEARYDLVVRYLPDYRDTKEAIENIRLLSPSGERVSLAQLCKISVTDGASEVYREGTRATSPSNTASAGATWAAPWKKPSRSEPTGEAAPRLPHRLGRASTKARSVPRRRLMVIVPLTFLLIFHYSLHHVQVTEMGVVDSGQCRRWRPSADCWRCYSRGTNFSVSSGVGFLALFGVSVQTGVIMLEYINQLRARGHTI